ncbi:pyridoxamine 5'-phosphate oxidase [Kitasatospora sp. GP30]|uniref:pyridoxine/pyridoxamine 5'-phosphate oxidase n=1 Tax=Kitasatospora sp. GP30 TaxID=3035084 RepID=UPI000C71063A|nr:pyridoxal 5'-phosphate synthase [Kitasatospora sp. GP30]MDH6140169.1 pyridoxamine 5'-phosphate oxidase [Kitasatospora sp. GP30]
MTESPDRRLAELRELLFARPAMARELPGFDPEAAPAGPGELFVDWLTGAMRAEVPDAQVAVLGTTGLDGTPDARVVMLRELDPVAGVWSFHAGADSPKGRQLAADPRAALTWYWPALGRQVRVRGPVVTTPAERLAEVFRALSTKSRVAALVGRQSEPLAEPAEFRAAWQAAERRLAEDPELLDPAYVRYGVRAEQVEFWQGSFDRQHVRLVYRRAGDAWTRELVWP